MLTNRKFHRPPSNAVYEIDGASYGLDDDLADAIKSSISRRLESKTLEIPRLPQVAGRILELSRNPDASIDEVVKAISTDPPLAARILARANSAAYGGGQTIVGLKPALMRLGTRVVRDMVFLESMGMRIFSVRSYRSIMELSWKLSIGTAIACDALSQVTGLERDSAFLLGLLHETGMPVLVSAIAEYEKQNGERSFGQDVVEILLSQLHEEVGAYVLKSWGMPPSVVDAAVAHHRYRGTATATASHRLVHAGNLICQHLGIGDAQRDVEFAIEHVFVDLNLADCDKISPILDTVTSEVASLTVGR